jgi:predicted nucleotidyltransferase
MVYKKSKIKNIVLEFIKELNRRRIPVKQVILFGSYAHGKPNLRSDIDLAVVSPKFKNMDDIKRIMILSDAARHIKTPRPIDINPIGFTDEELEKADYFEIGGEIVEKGVVLYNNV